MEERKEMDEREFNRRVKIVALVLARQKEKSEKRFMYFMTVLCSMLLVVAICKDIHNWSLVIPTLMLVWSVYKRYKMNKCTLSPPALTAAMLLYKKR